MWDAGFSCRRPTFCAFKRNRRASTSLSPVLIHFLAPYGKLYRKLLALALEQTLASIPPAIIEQRHSDSAEACYSIPPKEEDVVTTVESRNKLTHTCL
jgi:hypothetical protein